MASGVGVGVEDTGSEGVKDGVGDIQPETDGVDVGVGVCVKVACCVGVGVEDGVSDIRPEPDGVAVDVAVWVSVVCRVGVGVEGSVSVGVEDTVSEGVEDGVSEIRPEADGVDVDVSLGVGDLVTDRVSTGVHDGLQVPVVLVDADIDLVGLAVQVRVDADERDFDGVSVCVGVERRV